MATSFYSSLTTKVKVTLLYFFVAATLGLSLRMIQAGLLSGNFKHLLHTHSHIVLLGWLYNALFILLQYGVFKKKEGPLNTVFWLSQLTFLGMLFSFPFQGYAFFSILFSTLYLFCSYALVYYLFKYSKELENKNVAKLLRWSGIYLVFSSFGPFSLGFIMAKGLAETFWFKLSIYWFLHFLYNGFFALVVFAFVLNKLPNTSKTNAITWLMSLSVIPLYALSVLWLDPHFSIYGIALVGSLFQLVAFGILVYKQKIHSLFQQKWTRILLYLSVISYALKSIFQVFAVIPSVQLFLTETVSFSVIGFIHLVMLGFFTLFVIAVFIENNYLPISKTVKLGIQLLILGIILSETLLFSQSIAVYFKSFQIPDFFTLLFWASALMPVGIGLVVFGGKGFKFRG